jgi:hypothetical protein
MLTDLDPEAPPHVLGELPGDGWQPAIGSVVDQLMSWSNEELTEFDRGLLADGFGRYHGTPADRPKVSLPVMAGS